MAIFIQILKSLQYLILKFHFLASISPNGPTWQQSSTSETVHCGIVYTNSNLEKPRP